jgi:hypothetical protein
VVPKTLTITKTAKSASCSDIGGGCIFNINIANSGDEEFKGTVEIEDVVTADGAQVPTAGQDTDADAGSGFSCSNNGTSFTCKADSVTIPAKGSEDITIGFKLGSPSTAKEIKNCAKLTSGGPESCATIPLKSGPILRLRKSTLGTHCTPSNDGGESCSFVIFVFNVGNQAYDGPMTITDSFTPDATAKLTSFSSSGEAGNPWTCTGAGVQVCDNKSVKLEVGGTLSVSTSRAPQAKSPTYENCAELTGPAAAVSDQPKSCATVRDLDTPPAAEPANPKFAALTVAKTADGASCFPEGNCAFTITVTNTGTETFSGFLEIRDQLKDANGAPLSRARLISDAPAPWNCDESGGGFFFCQQSNAMIEPGKSISVKMGFAPDTTDAQQIENCASIEGGTAAPACAKISVFGKAKEIPFANPRIKVTEEVLTPTCALAGPCSFVATFTNVGSGPFEGALAYTGSINQLVNNESRGGAHVEVQTIGKCTATDKGSVPCTINNLKLAPGGAVSVGVTVTPGKVWSKGNELEHCTIFNSADSKSDLTIDKPANPTEDFACAKARLDPFALKITKSGAQSCQPGANCSFDLEIFNPGPILHDDPVTIADNLTGIAGAEIVSITQVSGDDAFPCSPAPTKLPFSCTGKMRLEIDERDKYTMVVKLPAEAPAQGWFSNCASVSPPQAAVGQAATGGTPSENSCRVVTLENTCTGGREPTKDGSCACPPGTSWDGKACNSGSGGTNKTAPQTEEQAKPKQEQQKPPAPKTGRQKQVCPPDRPVGVSPYCCPQTYEYRDKKCRCPKGKVEINGICQVPPKPAPQEPPKEKTCPPNTVLQNGNCRPLPCPPGTVGVPPICVPQGQKKEKQKPKEEDCPPGYRKLSKANKYGTYCEPIDQGPPKCPADKPNGTPPNCCAPGTRFTEGFCYPDKCSPGWTGLPPHCQPPAQQQQPQPTGPSPKCAPPLIGTPPNCHCPGGYSFDPESKMCERNVQ